MLGSSEHILHRNILSQSLVKDGSFLLSTVSILRHEQIIKIHLNSNNVSWVTSNTLNFLDIGRTFVVRWCMWTAMIPLIRFCQSRTTIRVHKRLWLYWKSMKLFLMPSFFTATKIYSVNVWFEFRALLPPDNTFNSATFASTVLKE